MVDCTRPDCGDGTIGTIDEQGFCSVCNRRPLPARSVPTRERVPGERYGVSVGVAPVRSNPWYGLELVEAAGLTPVAPPPPPPRTGEPVPEHQRTCGTCRRPVGRGQAGGPPGRTEGYCAFCGAAFDFSSPLRHRVPERYDIIGLLDSGSYGDAYLAQDRHLGAQVVLKEMKHTSVAKTAERERDALVGLRHDSIVRIMGYEPEGRHLVLEYVPGSPLAALDDDQLPVLLAHGLRILQALDYLHGKRLLHCDVKPSNIIRFREDSHGREGVRLIDFGAVRSLDRDTGPVTTFSPPYAPPPDDPEHTEPTPGFDLFCLGRTLQMLCQDQLSTPSALGAESLRLLLERATDKDEPQRRFRTASGFGEQLSGVIRQVLAGGTKSHQVMRASALFGAMVESLHGGLGTARPMSEWSTATPDDAGRLTLCTAFSVPPAPVIATALPAPVTDPEGPPLTATAQEALAACRQAVHALRPDSAASALQQASLSEWHWLHCWYSGLIALADTDIATAAENFTKVRALLPGELIPQLALGLCAEHRGDLPLAQSHYSTVYGTTPALGAAGFGLARVHLRDGRRKAAVTTAQQLAKEFRYGREARVAQVRLLAAMVQENDGVPEEAELTAARQTLTDLAAGEVVDRAVDEVTAASLHAEIAYATFLRTRDRQTLSTAVRGLAQHAGTQDEHTALVDLANGLRPPLVWPWRRRRRRSGQSV